MIDVIYPLEIQKEKERILIQKQKQQKKQMYIQQYITKYSDQDMEHGVILSVAKNKRGQISYLKIYSGDRE
ncbi:MAG: hypothetical protein U9Q15_05250 [Patescibacteria group bacterium]|nr:hypothetical protein [Patescibacteria group bacterium]